MIVEYAGDMFRGIFVCKDCGFEKGAPFAMFEEADEVFYVCYECLAKNEALRNLRNKRQNSWFPKKIRKRKVK